MKKQKETYKLTPEKALEEKRRQVLGRRDIWSFAFRLIALLALIWIMCFLIFRIVIAPDDSMQPTIRGRDLELVYRLDRNFRQSDIVVYEQDSQQRTGRIVALPGDTVEITDERELKINGNTVRFENVYYETPAYDSDVTYPRTLGEGEYFILSDMREGAEDSREFGPVQEKNIEGKVILVLRKHNL